MRNKIIMTAVATLFIGLAVTNFFKRSKRKDFEKGNLFYDHKGQPGLKKVKAA